jgi:hypothetical protein
MKIEIQYQQGKKQYRAHQRNLQHIKIVIQFLAEAFFINKWILKKDHPGYHT